MKPSDTRTLKPGPNSLLGRSFLVLAALSLMASGSLGWLDQPILGWLNGNAIHLSSSLPSWISYGAASFAIGLLCLVSLAPGARLIALFTSTLALTLSLHFLLAFSVFHADQLIRIADLNQQAQRIFSFSKYLPPNAGVQPLFDAALSLDTIYDRLSATLHFATLGWYAAVLGSLLSFAAFATFPRTNPRGRLALAVIVASILAYLTLRLYPFAAAQHHQNKANHYMATGLFAEALHEYSLARVLDKNLNHMQEFHAELGRAAFHLGNLDDPDSYVYRALTSTTLQEYPSAIMYLSQVRADERSMPSDMRNRLLSWSYVSYGLSEYRMGIPASAIDQWKKAAAADPGQIQPYYFMSRAYHDISSYDEAVQAGLHFLRISKDKIMRANASANVADSYHGLRRYDLARQYYVESVLLDNFANMRAVMSLVGK